MTMKPDDIIPEEERDGVLVSPAFWIGGALAILAWVAVGMALG